MLVDGVSHGAGGVRDGRRPLLRGVTLKVAVHEPFPLLLAEVLVVDVEPLSDRQLGKLEDVAVVVEVAPGPCQKHGRMLKAMGGIACVIRPPGVRTIEGRAPLLDPTQQVEQARRRGLGGEHGCEHRAKFAARPDDVGVRDALRVEIAHEARLNRVDHGEREEGED